MTETKKEQLANAKAKLAVMRNAKNDLYQAVADAIQAMGGRVNFQPKDADGKVDPNAGFYNYCIYTDQEGGVVMHYLVAAEVSEADCDGKRTIYLLTEYDSTTTRIVYSDEEIKESENFESLEGNYIVGYTLSEIADALENATPVE